MRNCCFIRSKLVICGHLQRLNYGETLAVILLDKISHRTLRISSKGSRNEMKIIKIYMLVNKDLIGIILLINKFLVTLIS